MMGAATLEDSDIWVINLARAPDRREHMARVLDPLGLRYAFFPAVDGRHLTEEDLAAYDRETRLRTYFFDLAPNEIACYLSHMRCIRTAYAMGKRRVAILEDDVVPNPGFRAVLDHCLALPQGHDLIKLHGNRRRRAKPVARIGDGHSLVRPYNVVGGSVAYLVDREGMRKLLAYGERITMQVDIMLDRYWDSGLRLFAVYPFAVSLADVPSTIGGRNRDRWRGAEGGRMIRFRLKIGKWKDGLRKRVHNLRIALGG